MYNVKNYKLELISDTQQIEDGIKKIKQQQKQDKKLKKYNLKSENPQLDADNQFKQIRNAKEEEIEENCKQISESAKEEEIEANCKQMSESQIESDEVFIKFIESIKQRVGIDKDDNIFAVIKNDSSETKLLDKINNVLIPHNLIFPDCLDIVISQKEQRNKTCHPTVKNLIDKKSIIHKELNGDAQILNINENMLEFISQTYSS